MDWQNARRGGVIEDQRLTLLQRALNMPSTQRAMQLDKFPTAAQRAGRERFLAQGALEDQAMRYQNWQDLQAHPEWLELPAAGPERRTNAVLDRMGPLLQALGAR